MILNLDQLRAITCGAVSVAEDTDGVHFYRFTKAQMDLYQQEHTEHYVKTLSSAGIRLRFRTNSEKLFLHACMTDQGGSRKYFAIEFFKNGKRIDTIENFSDMDLRGDYTGIPVSMGDFSKNVKLGRGEKEVCIFLPWSAKTVIKELSLDDGATLTPVKPSKKMLCFGDSITQGYDALCPSERYISRLADYLDAEEFNKAIGGEFFYPALADTKETFVPDYITVAYGTNDWRKLPYETFLKDCRAFYENLSRNYPTGHIFAITPIWRKDEETPTDFPSFEAVEQHIRKVTEHLSNVTVIRGYDLVPKKEKYYADLRLHPNDLGFEKYYKNLKKKIEPYI